MKAERPKFTTSELTEATVILPKKLSVLQEKTKQAQDRMEQLKNYASNTAYEIVCKETITGDRFLDMALVLASYLQEGSNRPPYTPDKIIEATQKIRSRLTDLDTKLRDSPGKPILFDRTRLDGNFLFLDLGKLNDSPSIKHTIKNTRLSSSWFWHEVSRSIQIRLEGYRQLNHVDNMYHPPMIRIFTNPDYQSQWFSEDITGFFAIDQLPDYDYNGLKQELFGKPTEYVGGIFIGKDEILNHFNYTQKILTADSNELTRTKNLAALQSLSIAQILANF